ncbi:cuticle protein AMP1B-like [Penaeus japonicus]|uniref:cuticle protein AMP1B-like n=1 Tax=Penaeus japonicus TaxID=27405 RepID=UPI001C7155E2|nr:cuticle protein AMP1B-like [Penaeus japonicus]
MKFVVLSLVVAGVFAAPQYESEQRQARFDDSREHVPILKDERVIDNDGRYTFDVATGNGIVVSESGSPGAVGSINSAGSFAYTAPDGTPVEVKFIADENGYQPQSDLLPVPPAFPHPIPQFVLDQIAFAAEQDAARARGELRDSSQTSDRYDAPN